MAGTTQVTLGLKSTTKIAAAESAESVVVVVPIVLVLVDVDIIIHRRTATEATIEATDKTGEERNYPKATKTITTITITTKTTITTITTIATATATEDTSE